MTFWSWECLKVVCWLLWGLKQRGEAGESAVQKKPTLLQTTMMNTTFTNVMEISEAA
jgi:hypothetical protein